MKATYTLNREMSYWNATSNHTDTSLIRNSNITNDLGYKFSDPIVGESCNHMYCEMESLLLLTVSQALM